MTSIAHISLPQYEIMIEHGVFDGEHRQHVELIRGEIRQMNPIGYEHTAVVDFLAEWSFRSGPSTDRRVRIQHTLRLPDSDSAPEPDVAWVARKSYTQHPSGADVLLLVEVADTSLAGDCGEKAALYAGSSIRDYWVVDVQGRSLIVHGNPQGDSYGEVRTLRGDDSIAPLCDPAARLTVRDLFSML